MNLELSKRSLKRPLKENELQARERVRGLRVDVMTENMILSTTKTQLVENNIGKNHHTKRVGMKIKENIRKSMWVNMKLTLTTNSMTRESTMTGITTRAPSTMTRVVITTAMKITTTSMMTASISTGMKESKSSDPMTSRQGTQKTTMNPLVSMMTCEDKIAARAIQNTTMSLKILSTRSSIKRDPSTKEKGLITAASNMMKKLVRLFQKLKNKRRRHHSGED